jgi:hypothetical protein
MTPMQGPCSAAASGFAASGFFAAGLAGEGLAGEGFVAEGFVAEGFVAEGLAGKGLGAAVGVVCASANHKAMLWITFCSAASGELEQQNCNRESVRVNRASTPKGGAAVCSGGQALTRAPAACLCLSGPGVSKQPSAGAESCQRDLRHRTAL